MNGVALAIGSWFGCGYVPRAPGTAGSLAATLLALLAVRYGGAPAQTPLIAGAALFLPGVWAAGRVERMVGRRDPNLVVVDEVVGQWIGLAGASGLGWTSALVGFLLFRCFDIWKPFPVKRLEVLPAGWGIMLDDVMAGIYTALVLLLLRWLGLF
jgi:phosphatidylglycerophosphatase A